MQALAAELTQIELVDPFHEFLQMLRVGGEESRFEVPFVLPFRP